MHTFEATGGGFRWLVGVRGWGMMVLDESCRSAAGVGRHEVGEPVLAGGSIAGASAFARLFFDILAYLNGYRVYLGYATSASVLGDGDR